MTYRQEAAIKKSVGRVGCISFQFFLHLLEMLMYKEGREWEVFVFILTLRYELSRKSIH